jgi:predicted RNase H-like HicB family nuclease
MNTHDYAVVITSLPEAEGGGYLATVPDLPGCTSDGETREEAAHNIGDAIAQWIEEAGKLGREIPVPRPIIAAE